MDSHTHVESPRVICQLLVPLDEAEVAVPLSRMHPPPGKAGVSVPLTEACPPKAEEGNRPLRDEENPENMQPLDLPPDCPQGQREVVTANRAMRGW